MKNWKKDPHFDAQTGAILLQIMGILIVIFTLVGVTMSFSAMEVDSSKNPRVHAELRKIGEAVRRYAQDRILAATSMDDMVDCFPNPGLQEFDSFSNLINNDTEPTWKGPYLEIDSSNTNWQNSMTKNGGRISDPWRHGYEHFKTVTFSEVSITLVSRGPKVDYAAGQSAAAGTDPNSDDDISLKIDLTPFVAEVTRRRLDAISGIVHSPQILSEPNLCQIALETQDPVLGWSTFSHNLRSMGQTSYLPNSDLFLKDPWGDFFYPTRFEQVACGKGIRYRPTELAARHLSNYQDPYADAGQHQGSDTRGGDAGGGAAPRK